MEIKVYSYNTCKSLLDYKTNPELRQLYSGEQFEYSNAEFLDQPVFLRISEDELSFNSDPSSDLQNSIKIFTALKDLDLVQANDKRLWVTLTHTLFFSYSKDRWNISNSSSNEVIKDRFHFEGYGLRQRNQNSIARLWWAAKITYDETRSDPFELTKILWEKQDFYQNLIDRKFSTYKGVLHAFIKFYSENKYLDLKKDMRKLFKGLNAYGGVRILPLLDANEVEIKLQELSKFYGIKLNRLTEINKNTILQMD
jgi:hypothetical protein